MTIVGLVEKKNIQFNKFKKNIKLELAKKYEKPIYVKADKFRIRQVLVNLITNSIKYGKENGTTEVTIEDLVKPEQEKLNQEWDKEREKIKNSKLPKSETEAKITELAETYLKKINQLRTPEEKKKRQGILDQKKREAEADRAGLAVGDLLRREHRQAGQQ